MTDMANVINNWEPPAEWLRIQSVDVHVEGELLRVIISGVPNLKGDTILDRWKYAKQHFDHLRKALMWEPRGHVDMYGCIITSAVSPEADFGVLFAHNESFSTICGHGIIGVTKVVLETGMLPKKEPETVVKIDTPAGLVTAYARIDHGSVTSIYFHNVPSYAQVLDQVIDIRGLGLIRYDVAFGGAFYVFVNADEIGIETTPENYHQLIRTGMAIKHSVMKDFEIEHPFEKDLIFLYGTIFIGSAQNKDVDSRNVCVFAEGEVDRSPNGTGVSARMALHYAKGEISINQPMVFESIIGSTFIGSVVKTLKYGSYDAVIPSVEGKAYITGRYEYLIDPTDPFKNGFILR